MAKVKIFNSEIIVNTLSELDMQKLYLNIKFKMIKAVIQDTLCKFKKNHDVPSDFIGFLLTIEAEISHQDFVNQSEVEILAWFHEIIFRIKSRESLHHYWNSIMGANRLSIALTSVHNRMMNAQLILQLRSTVDKIYAELKNQLEIEMIASYVQNAIKIYRTTAILPIDCLRDVQQQQLLEKLQNIDTPLSALYILKQSISNIEQHHITKSSGSGRIYYQSQSRLAKQLHGAAQLVAQSIHHRQTNVEFFIEQAIRQYLDDDILYHNRQRLIKIKQLLSQIQSDHCTFSSEQKLQKKYKLRSTLDYYIYKIDKDHHSTLLFAKFRSCKRSRLALKLEQARDLLIEKNEIASKALDTGIKLPIKLKVNEIYNGFKQHLTSELMQEYQDLIHAIEDADTPNAIETILCAHIQSYIQAGDVRGQIAAYFEIAVNEWQRQKLLPSSSDYKLFLSKLANQRVMLENSLVKLMKK